MDRVQKIRAEVKRRAEYLRSVCEHGEANEIEYILSFIDSMQEEPKECMYSKDNYTDEDRKVLCDGCEEDCKYNKKETVNDNCLLNKPSIPDIVDEHWWEMLGEEPVSEDKMTISKEWFEHCKKSWYNEGYINGKYNLDRQFEESVSEDLEQAIDTYLATYFGGEKEKQDWPFLKKMAIHFAKWQKEQMMAKAVDGEIGYWNIRGLSVNAELPHSIKEGDKVKVIVIKEETK